MKTSQTPSIFHLFKKFNEDACLFQHVARLNRPSTTIAISVAVLLVLVLPLSINAVAQSNQPVGSEWIYDYADEIVGIIFSGEWTYSCERIASTSLGGTEREAVEYSSVLSATASIAPYASGSVAGEISEIGIEYYDLETDDLVGHVYNRALTLNATLAGYGSLNMSSAEMNETYYMPPGGMGTVPSTIYPGDIWEKNYTKHSKTLGHNESGYFSEESTYNTTISYEFVGYETVSVPAGDFDCVRMRMVTSYGVGEDAWYSYSILNYVKIIDTAGLGETVTYELSSYTLAQEPAAPTEMASNLFIAVFFSFIAATVMAAIYASMSFRGKKPPEFQSLQPESPEKDIYRP